MYGQEEEFDHNDYIDDGLSFDEMDDGDMDDMDPNNQNYNKSRNKRRSKNDNEGRTFICGCGKSYLSYPALYTHIKQKHNGTSPEGTNAQQYHTGRGRGRPRKEKPEHNLGVVVLDDNRDEKPNEAKIQSNLLSRDLTAEMLDQETQQLGRVCFPLKLKQVTSMAAQFGMGNLDGDNFKALDWYAQDPAEEDQLFKEVSDSYWAVMEALNQIKDEHRIENKANAGPSTQYLLLVSDEDRALFTIDQVLALYLIDVAERCKKSPPLMINLNQDSQHRDQLEQTTTSTTNGKPGSTNRASAMRANATAGQDSAANRSDLERNNYHFYMTVCVFVQLYRSCLNDSIYQTFEGRTSLMAAPEDQANFTQQRAPDCLPLICNEFLNEYLSLKCNIFDFKMAVGLTQHLNMWLYHRKFTKTKIELLK